MQQPVMPEATRELGSQRVVVTQLNLIASVFPSGVLAVDREGRIILANDELCRMFGYDKGELAGCPIETLLPEHLREKHVEHRSRFFEAPCMVPMGATGCLTGRRKDGSTLLLEIGLVPFETENGTIVLCAAADVTFEKEMERRLNESLSLEKAIMDNAAYSIIATSADGTIRIFNRAAEHMLGYEASEMIGKKSPAAIHDPVEMAARARELSLKLGRTVEPGFDVFVAKLSTGTVEDREWTYVRKDGARFPVLLSVTAIRDAQGVVTGYVGIAKDITARRQAERRSRDVVEAAPSGVVLIDKGCRIALVNHEIERIFGYRRDEMIGQHVNLIVPDACDQASKERHAEFLTRCAGGQIGSGLRFELVGRRKNGSRFPVEMTLRAAETQEDLFALACINDITERKAVEERLRQAKEAADLASRAKTEFLSSMSHELRTPLSAIIGFAQGLLERVDRHPLNDHQKDRIEKIHRSGLHLLGLINDVLDIARVESGRVEVNPTTFDAGAVLSDVYDLMAGLAREKPSVAVYMEIAPELPPITTDREKLKQILINLAGNAIKFTNEGSVTLDARFENGHFAFSVADTGIGIPQEELGRVFEKFHQVRQAAEQSIKGSGLGLTICRQFADVLGGSLSVSSEVGKGSTFKLILPERIPEKQPEPHEMVITGPPYSSPIPECHVDNT
jgi:PAS domain S-box-containing protein